MKKLIRHIALALCGGILAFCWACANRGSGPQGGPKDVAPPIPVVSKPENGARNYKKSSIEIQFNEIVLLENAYEKVVVSPPQQKAAIVKAYGKKVAVELVDTLRDSTTYVIDFSDAIVDNNEKNKLLDYYFSFSTGDRLDSLMIGGTLIDAQTLNPLTGVTIGVHRNLDDSAFVKQPFDAVTKTDDKGGFWVKGIPEGSYRVYALKDMNGNFRFDQKGELVAFLDSVVSPNVEFIESHDTVWRDDRTVDTIMVQQHPKYTSGIVLRGFVEDFSNQYFKKSERLEPYKWLLYFNAPIDSMPTIEPLNFEFGDYKMQKGVVGDTLTLWLSDTLLWKKDTLSYVLTYQRTDSLNELSWQSDTLKTIIKKKAEEKKSSTKRRSTETQSKKIEFLKMNTTASSNFDVYAPLYITFDVPTRLSDSAKVVLEQQVDTLWKEVTMQFSRVDSLGMRYAVAYDWKPETSYRLRIDSASFVGISGVHTNKYEGNIKVRSLESYGTLYMMMPSLEGNEILQLLDKNENVLRELPAKAETEFKYLNPGDYYVRMFIDANKNGKWDTGLYSDKQQPEEMFYYEYKLTVRAFWDVEETWNYRALPITDQKPYELIETAQKKKK